MQSENSKNVEDSDFTTTIEDLTGTISSSIKVPVIYPLILSKQFMNDPNMVIIIRAVGGLNDDAW